MKRLFIFTVIGHCQAYSLVQKMMTRHLMHPIQIQQVYLHKRFLMTV